MSQFDIGEFDMNGIIVGIDIAEEIVAFIFSDEGVAAAVYLKVAATVYGWIGAVTACRYRNVTTQHNECRDIGRGNACP